MGYRLSKIYTRTGDDGTTGLADGTRVPKDDILIVALGEFDELNCLIGMILVQDLNSASRDFLRNVQNDLFDAGAELSLPGHTAILDAHVTELEHIIDTLNEPIPPLKEFILPGGGAAATACHVARASCRRAERTLVQLNRYKPLNAALLRYINRLSDALFVLARVVARASEQGEVLWQQRRLEPTKA